MNPYSASKRLLHYVKIGEFVTYTTFRENHCIRGDISYPAKVHHTIYTNESLNSVIRQSRKEKSFLPMIL